MDRNYGVKVKMENKGEEMKQRETKKCATKMNTDK